MPSREQRSPRKGRGTQTPRVSILGRANSISIKLRTFSTSRLQLLQHINGVLVLWVELQRLLVVGNGKILLPAYGIGFCQAVIYIPRLRIKLRIELEDSYCLRNLRLSQQCVAKIV